MVLDESFREEVKNVRIFNPDDLMEQFLSYVATASRDVRGTNRPVLVLIFGHGAGRTYSITIGGSGHFSKCNGLSIGKLKETILHHNPNPNIALLTTSCYGGGWVQTPFLNITTMAGVNEESELLSLPESNSLNRCCGSRFASSVAKALIRTEILDLDLLSYEASEALSSPTYAALTSIIHEILLKEIDV
ncbi:hypothetical protein MMC20_000742 [Loxospora ochrophaea]|nr:hypothetical protein [Loxospora ochrophaea]